MSYHFPFLQRLSGSRQLRILAKLTGAKKNSLRVYLDVDPEIAMERINKRGTDGGRHENLADLTRLKNKFDELIELIGASGVSVCKIKTNDKTVSEVADEVERMIERKISDESCCRHPRI
jgi:thymidylate kinase